MYKTIKQGNTLSTDYLFANDMGYDKYSCSSHLLSAKYLEIQNDVFSKLTAESPGNYIKYYFPFDLLLKHTESLWKRALRTIS